MDDAGMEWTPLAGPAGPGERLALRVGSTEAARMVDRVNGTWFAVLHYPDGRKGMRDCASLESGKAGCEAWAMRHMDALLARDELRHLTWLARQTWRGEDCAAARAKLSAMGRDC